MEIAVSAASSFRDKFAIDKLEKTFVERISTSRSIGLDRVRASIFSERVGHEIPRMRAKVLEGSYKFTAYKEKLISKGANVPPRQVSIPTVRDRIVLRALCEVLGEVFPDSQLKLPHVVIESLKAALASGKYSQFAKIDIKNFYPSLPHKLIESSTWKKARKRELRALIRSAIQTPTVPASRGGSGVKRNRCGVPQGLAISNILAEVAMQKFDSKFGEVPGVWYHRYVDDILVLTGPGQAEVVANSMIKELRRMKLSPHELGPDSKSMVGDLSRSFSFLGYWISEQNVLVREESIRRFESSIAKILTAYSYRIKAPDLKAIDRERALAYCRWKLDLRVTGCVFEGRRMGWVAYFSQITSTRQLRLINLTVAKLLKRFNLDEHICPESLIKTYYELRRGGKGSKYIPDFDALTINQQRECLAMWMGERVGQLSDQEVEQQLKVRLTKVVSDLEADIAHAS